MHFARKSRLAIVFGVALSASGVPGQDLQSTPFGDWELRCAVTEADEVQRACELVQPVAVTVDGVPVEVLRLALSPVADRAEAAELALVILTPRDVHLASDFGIEIDGRDRRLVRYRNCNDAGCWVVVPAGAQLLAALRRGREGTGIFRLLDGQVVRARFSLMGVTAGLNALAAHNAAP